MTFSSRAVSRDIGVICRGTLMIAMLPLLASCAGMGEAMSAHTDVVAQAAGKELRVEETAQMLAANPEIPADPQVVGALADLWVDYALLATAVAEDSSLAAVDIASFIEPVREQALISQLRELVINADTVIDEAELERRWALEAPNVEIHARHILLRTPAAATDVQRDSIVQHAESIRARALAGEPFEDLAAEFSQDPGSGIRGGDLGFFGRGRMVEPFEDAAFQLGEGEVSSVVETPFGYHIIKVEERRQPDLGADREQFRQFLVQQSLQDAERLYLDSIAAEANVQIAAGGLEVVREIATQPGMNLRGRAADRAIVTYDGGSFTAGEFVEFVRVQPAQMQSAFATAPDDQLQTGLEQLVQMELLLAEAEERQLTLSAEDEERIRSDARAAIREVVVGTGFAEAARVGASATALDDHVKVLVEGVVSGTQPFVPLGRLGSLLRELYPNEINAKAFPDVVSRLAELRADQPGQPQLPGAPGQPGMPTAPGGGQTMPMPMPSPNADPAVPMPNPAPGQ